jgi:hypothetical protein
MKVLLKRLEIIQHSIELGDEDFDSHPVVQAAAERRTSIASGFSENFN